MRENQLEKLFKAADKDDAQTSTLQDIAVKAGMMWICACDYFNYKEDKLCGGCGQKKPRKKRTTNASST